MKNRYWLLSTLILFSLGSFQLSKAQTDNQVFAPELYEGLKYRLIGPFRGGRSTTVTGIPSQPHTFLMGTTGGGVWKTEDAGGNWKNISDKYINCGSIGAIEVSLSDPNIMYAGTGSASPRGNISAGIGMFKSSDGGETWQAIGLKKAGQISKIQIHPKNPDLVYAAVLGNVFGKNPERGVYRSKDGGASWDKIHYLNDSTGASDLVMDPNNPRVLYAGMWRVERKPWTIIDGSDGGGLYKSTDGGDTWKKLAGGLPTGIGGKIGVAISPVNSQKVWMIREMKEESKGGIYHSSDGGKSWKRINGEHTLRQRAWYYSRIFADPKDEHTVYVTNTGFYRSVDGGKKFSRISTPHGDNHDLWINPDNPQIMIESNDGGANVSYNGGLTWSTQYNQPTAEFYRVAVDNQFPYRVYGAQQDNTTISVPSRSPGGLTPLENWQNVGGGESGHIAFDPDNPTVIYAGNYIGQIDRTDFSTGHSRNVVHYPQMHDGTAPRDIKYRFQWNAPIRLSPHDPNVLYHTSQYVHQSTDGGQTWKVISPDLTTNKDAYHDIPGSPVQHDHTGVELYTTIFAFEASPQEKGVLWAGTDDGRVHISKNEGEDWQEITPKNIPVEGTVNMIELSSHDPARAFIAVYKYRENDFKPYIFRTNNYGKSWKLLTDGKNGIPANHFVRVVREDPVKKGLLYAGTEFGMYISFDDGAHWQSFQNNLPVTPITDMVVHRGDLVISTQGRSFWILDDLSVLHQLDKKIAKTNGYLYQPRTAYRSQLSNYRGPAAPPPAPGGAMIYGWFADKPDSTKAYKLEILGVDGKILKTYSTEPDKSKKDSRLKVSQGFNRWSWDLRATAPKLLEGSFMSLADTRGPVVAPGTYTIKLTGPDLEQTQSLTVGKDPRWQQSDEDLQAQYELATKVMTRLNEIHDVIRRIRSIRKQVNDIANVAAKSDHKKELETQAKTLSKKLTALEKKLIQTQNKSGQDPINYPSMIDDQYAYLYSTINNQDARPTKGCYERWDDLEQELAPHLEEFEQLLKEEVKAFEEMLEKREVPRIIKD
jgi:photosystem II stability/assembly factor-like uncharacterized protein